MLYRYERPEKGNYFCALLEVKVKNGQAVLSQNGMELAVLSEGNFMFVRVEIDSKTGDGTLEITGNVQHKLLAEGMPGPSGTRCFALDKEQTRDEK